MNSAKQRCLIYDSDVIHDVVIPPFALIWAYLASLLIKIKVKRRDADFSQQQFVIPWSHGLTNYA